MVAVVAGMSAMVDTRTAARSRDFDIGNGNLPDKRATLYNFPRCGESAASLADEDLHQFDRLAVAPQLNGYFRPAGRRPTNRSALIDLVADFDIAAGEAGDEGRPAAVMVDDHDMAPA